MKNKYMIPAALLLLSSNSTFAEEPEVARPVLSKITSALSYVGDAIDQSAQGKMEIRIVARESAALTAKEKLQVVQNGQCEQLDLDPTIEGSKKKVANPDAGCDLGMSLPGLPNFNAPGLGMFDSCKVVQAITNETAEMINSEAQALFDAVEDEVNQALNQDLDLENLSNEYLGTDLEGTTDNVKFSK
jgi:hypothetical protein